MEYKLEKYLFINVTIKTHMSQIPFASAGILYNVSDIQLPE